MQYPQESQTWTIRDRPTIKRLNKAIASDAIDSIIFEMHKCKWFLRFRPNGLANRKYLGNTFLILYLTGLPPNRSSINFRYTLCLLETNTTYSQTVTFKKHFLNISWDKNVLLTKDIKNLKQYTLTVQIELLAIYDQNGLDVLHEYHINDEYDDINLELEQNLKSTKHKKTRSRILRPKFVKSKSNSLSLKKRLSSADKDTLSKKHSGKSKSKAKSFKKLSLKSSKTGKTGKTGKTLSGTTEITGAESVGVGAYGIVGYNFRLDKLEQEMLKLNGIIMSLAKSVNTIEEKLVLNESKENDIDSYATNHKYTVLIQEVNNMKREITKLRQNQNMKNEKQLVLTTKQRILITWFIEKVKLPQYYEIFVENDLIDFEVVYKITKEELKDMGIVKVGHQMKILQEIEILATNKQQDLERDNDNEMPYIGQLKTKRKHRYNYSTLSDTRTDRILEIVMSDNEDIGSNGYGNVNRSGIGHMIRLGMNGNNGYSKLTLSDSDDLYRRITNTDVYARVGNEGDGDVTTRTTDANTPM